MNTWQVLALAMPAATIAIVFYLIIRRPGIPAWLRDRRLAWSVIAGCVMLGVVARLLHR